MLAFAARTGCATFAASTNSPDVIHVASASGSVLARSVAGRGSRCGLSETEPASGSAACSIPVMDIGCAGLATGSVSGVGAFGSVVVLTSGVIMIAVRAVVSAVATGVIRAVLFDMGSSELPSATRETACFRAGRPS